MGKQWKLVDFIFFGSKITVDGDCNHEIQRPTWLHIPGCLAQGDWSHHHDYLGRKDIFLYSSSVYSCHLFLISSAPVRSFISVLYWAHLCMKYSLGISNFLEDISSLSHSIVFLYFFLHWLLRKAFLSLLAILWNSAFRCLSFLFSFAFGFSSFHSYL